MGVCVTARTNVRLSDFLPNRTLTEDGGKGGMKDGVCVHVGEVDVIETRLESLR